MLVMWFVTDDVIYDDVIEDDVKCHDVILNWIVFKFFKNTFPLVLIFKVSIKCIQNRNCFYEVKKVRWN